MIRSTFDGLRRLTSPTSMASISAAVSNANVKNRLKQRFESARIQNQETNTLVGQYHKAFAALYQASENIRLNQKIEFKEKVELLQKELQDKQKSSSHYLVSTAEFVPQNVEVHEDMQYYIIKAMQEGKTLHEVLPPTLLAQRLDAYSSGASSSSVGHGLSDTCSC